MLQAPVKETTICLDLTFNPSKHLRNSHAPTRVLYFYHPTGTPSRGRANGIEGRWRAQRHFQVSRCGGRRVGGHSRSVKRRGRGAAERRKRRMKTRGISQKKESSLRRTMLGGVVVDVVVVRPSSSTYRTTRPLLRSSPFFACRARIRRFEREAG